MDTEKNIATLETKLRKKPLHISYIRQRTNGYEVIRNQIATARRSSRTLEGNSQPKEFHLLWTGHTYRPLTRGHGERQKENWCDNIRG